MNKRKDKKLLWAQSAGTYKTYIKDSLSLSYELIGFEIFLDCRLKIFFVQHVLLNSLRECYYEEVVLSSKLS